MHPRTILRNELSAAVSAALPSVQLHVSRARALKAGVTKAVLIYVSNEDVSEKAVKLSKRDMHAEVIVMCSGNDESVSDELDEMCFLIEREISNSASGAKLKHTEIEYDGAGQSVIAVCVMKYDASKPDAI